MSLRRYFGLPASEAEKLLISCTFNEADIQQGKSFRTYAMDKMRYAKAFGSTQTSQLLTYVYNGIYPPLRQLLREPIMTDNAATYIAYIEDTARSHAEVVRGPSSGLAQCFEKRDNGRQAPGITQQQSIPVTPAHHYDEANAPYSQHSDTTDNVYFGNWRRDDSRQPYRGGRGGGRGGGRFSGADAGRARSNFRRDDNRYPSSTSNNPSNYDNSYQSFRGRGYGNRRFSGHVRRGGRPFRRYIRDGRHF